MGRDTPCESALPTSEERRRILEQAVLVLGKARALTAQLDQTEPRPRWDSSRVAVAAVGPARSPHPQDLLAA